MPNFDFIVKNDLTVGENVIVNGNSLSIGPVETYIGSNLAITTEQIVVDSSNKQTTRGAKYLIQVVAENEYQISEILIVHNGTSSKITEYGVLTTGQLPLATFATEITGEEVQLLASMNLGSGNLWFTKTSINTN